MRILYVATKRTSVWTQRFQEPVATVKQLLVWTQQIQPLNPKILCDHKTPEAVDTNGPGQSKDGDFAPSTEDIQHENPGFNAEKFEEASMDLLAGEVENFDELMDRLEGCE